MFDEVAFNRFYNLDSIEERLINFLIKSEDVDAQRIWKLLKYNSMDALSQKDLTRKEKSKLVDDGNGDQSGFKIFKQNFMEDAFVEETSLIKFYVDSVIPVNHLVSTVNVGIDIMTHNKMQLVYNDSFDEIENEPLYREIEKNIITKNRNTLLLKCLFSVLNGQYVEGVGQFQFNQQLCYYDQARGGIYNNKNYSGIKIIVSCQMSGVDK